MTSHSDITHKSDDFRTAGAINLNAGKHRSIPEPGLTTVDMLPTSESSLCVMADPDAYTARTAIALDVRAPRYTSYPTADQFIEGFGPQDYARELGSRSLTHAGPLSVYVHIPFCRSLCHFCGCNKTVTQRYDKAQPYVQSLFGEMALVDKQLTGERRLTQLHWGGGTPTFLRKKEIQLLMQGLRECYDFSPQSEISIEIDPRTVDDEKIEVLAAEGFNRMSLGVQDFNPAVQKAINRTQSVELTEKVLESARANGFSSTNFDLIYGLPLQTVEDYACTVNEVVRMRPERIALYSYAHMPSRFSAQRVINDSDLPSPEEKMAIFSMANQQLDAAGYVYIGMDHFALPDDELAVAYRTGRLHRNFQGYSTQPDNDLVALGASGISHVGTCYSQNLRGVNNYRDLINQGMLATQRGVELSRDDLLRRAIIMAIMCQGYVNKQSFEIAHLIDFDKYFNSELMALASLELSGFVTLGADGITVSAAGRRQALRLIAGVFDRYLQQKRERDTYSRVL